MTDLKVEDTVCGGYGDECEHCMYFHDPCFPEFDDIEDDEE